MSKEKQSGFSPRGFPCVPRSPAKVFTELGCPPYGGPGVYLMYFDNGADILARSGFDQFEQREPFKHDGDALLYVGASRTQVESRMWSHYSGDSANSNLRMTIASIYPEEFELDPRLIGQAKFCNFGTGEGNITRWMFKHTKLAYLLCPDPLLLEAQLIALFAPPLNITGRKALDYPKHLMALRRRFSRDHSFPRLPSGPVRRRKFEERLDRNAQGICESA